MSISNDVPEQETTPAQFAELKSLEEHAALRELEQQKLSAVDSSDMAFLPAEYPRWGMTGVILATVFFAALLIIGTVTQRSLNTLVPDKPAPTSGVVVSETANTVEPQPAYPTVYVQPAANPNQVPSPLPPAPEKPVR